MADNVYFLIYLYNLVYSCHILFIKQFKMKRHNINKINIKYVNSSKKIRNYNLFYMLVL